MPSGDRTGPRGLGPMTGRALGYCADYDTPGYTKGPGMGRGRGRGRSGYRGRGYGFGRAWGWDYRIPVYGQYIGVVPPRVSPENQLFMLKQEKDYLENELNTIKSAIDDIAKKIINLEEEKE
ncbi:MAG: DUF5320 domain-containing protein [Candidatus Hermodarchaeota archaeon]